MMLWECRLTKGIPAQAEFTYYDTIDRLQTSITLQDGCFGTATLMRIAALFMPDPTPPPLPNSDAPAHAKQPESPSKPHMHTDLSSSIGPQPAPSTALAMPLDGVKQNLRTASAGEATLNQLEGSEATPLGQAQPAHPASIPNSGSASPETSSDRPADRGKSASEPVLLSPTHTQNGRPLAVSNTSSDSAGSDLSSSTVTQTETMPGPMPDSPQAFGTSTAQKLMAMLKDRRQTCTVSWLLPQCCWPLRLVMAC